MNVLVGNNLQKEIVEFVKDWFYNERGSIAIL